MQSNIWKHSVVKEAKAQRSTPQHGTPGAAGRGVSDFKWDLEKCGGQKHGTGQPAADSMDVTNILDSVFKFPTSLWNWLSLSSFQGPAIHFLAK